jgi:hypothetical protein
VELGGGLVLAVCGRLSCPGCWAGEGELEVGGI